MSRVVLALPVSRNKNDTEPVPCNGAQPFPKVHKLAEKIMQFFWKVVMVGRDYTLY